MKRIKTGDEVIVITGKDSGKTGLVKAVKEDRVIVEGINTVKKHVKPDPQKNIQGGIVERETSIHISNIAILNPVTKKADRVKFKYLDDNKKVRIYASTGEQIAKN